MRRPEVEFWANQVIDRVLAKQPVEDDLVELKTDWPQDPAAAARRIAAHANGARFQPILWLIGLNEKAATVSGASVVDPATWYGQVTAQFTDRWAPEVSVYSFPHSSRTVVALLFRTDGAPYLVAAPNERLEVPWRGSTQTRSARRSELLSILFPSSQQPDVEVISATLTHRTTVNIKLSNDKHVRHDWHVSLDLYVTPRDEKRLYFPFHRMSAYAAAPSKTIVVDFPALTASREDVDPKSSLRPPLYCTGHELVIGGPGRITLSGHSEHEEPVVGPDYPDMTVHVTARAAGDDATITLTVPVRLVSSTPKTSAIWQGPAG